MCFLICCAFKHQGSGRKKNKSKKSSEDKNEQGTCEDSDERDQIGEESIAGAAG